MADSEPFPPDPTTAQASLPAEHPHWVGLGSIAWRLGVAMGLMLLLMGTVAALALHQIEELGGASQAIVAGGMRQMRLAREVETAAHESADALHALFLVEGRAKRVPLYARIDRATRQQTQALQALLADVAGGTDPSLVARIAQSRSEFDASFRQTVELVELDASAARPALVEQTLPALEGLMRSLDTLVAAKVAQAEAAADAIQAEQAGRRRQVLQLACLAVLVALGAALMITRSVAAPIREASRLARDIAAGNLDSPMPRAGSDEIGGLVTALADMRDSLAQREARIVDLAYRDPLTGLANRTLFNDRLGQAVATGLRSGQAFSVLLLDLDRFKDVNDLLGHPMGDALICEVGRRLAAALRRSSDTVARIGGDEFTVLLPAQGREAAARVARQLLDALEAPVVIGEQTLDVRGSIGVVTFPDDGASSSDLMARADAAMYAAKQGGSGYAAFDVRMLRPPEHGLSLLSDLRRAMDEHEFFLQYQPKLALAGDSHPAAEALIRWRHPVRGLVPPDHFIPFAEQTGAIKGITRWVLNEALEQLARWRADGFAPVLAVNISARDLGQGELPVLVDDLLRLHGVAPGQLILEVTESAVMEDPVRALAVLRQLDAMGIALALDDFGTGHSSLARLKELPLQELKIDRSFIRRLDADSADLRIVRSTIDLAHSLGLRVVAEGVETEGVARQLGSLGCDLAQGWLYARPLDAPAFTAWWAAHAGRQAAPMLGHDPVI